MSTPVPAIPRQAGPQDGITADDVILLLDGAIAHWSEPLGDCAACAEARCPGPGVCPVHAEDDRMAGLAQRLQSAIAAGGDQIVAALLSLARTPEGKR